MCSNFERNSQDYIVRSLIINIDGPVSSSGIVIYDILINNSR